MDAVKKFHCRVLLVVFLLGLCAPVALGAPAEDPPRAERWRALAETVFHHVARNGELGVPTGLTQDAEGFLWAGTENGLARWDGYRFRIYKSDLASERTLPGNFINTLYTDRRGRLWIGIGYGGGLVRYDHDHDDFVRYAVGLSGVSIRAIADDGAGGVWVATEGGLDHVLPEGGVSHLRHDEHDPGSLPNDHLNAALLSRDGTLWVGTAAGLVRRGPGDRAFVPVPLPVPDGKVADVVTLFEDTLQRLWIGTRHRGAYVIDPRDMRARQILESDPQHGTLPTEMVLAIAEVRPGEVWIGTSQGVVAVDTIGFGTRSIRHDPLLQDSLADGEITALYKDRSGLIWVSTLNALSFYNPSQDAVYTIPGGPREGLSSGYAQSQAPDGRLWLGHNSGGIDILDPLGIRSAALRPDPHRPETALPRSSIHTFALTESGDVYVGTEEGLYRVDALARHATRFTLAGRDPAASVGSLLLQRGVLWVGGNDGLWEVDASSSRPGARTALPARGWRG
jgi:ligand-binding sensor domain-containing protein